jgi:H+-transporting ATPase
VYKRVIAEFTHDIHQSVTIAKGLPIKLVDTMNGGEDDAVDQWKVEDYEEMLVEVENIDRKFSLAGYKTLGVAVKFGNGKFRFMGILPMLDPPRHDTAETIQNLINAGISVKMVTGDHLNIGIETARLIGAIFKQFD